MNLLGQTQKNYDNSHLPSKTKKIQGEVRTTAFKIYTTFIHKIFDYSLILPFKYSKNIL